MRTKERTQIEKQIHSRYINMTKQSRRNAEAAKEWLPGGDTRSSVYYFPYPAFVERGSGCWVFDSDGNRYLDCQNNYASLIHGHGHPNVVKAVKTQLEKGFVFGAPNLHQSALARILCERFPSLERLRFTNSGSEATMFAIRLARAHTRRDVVIKIDGGYHGTHDFAEISQKANSDPTKPVGPRLDERGIPKVLLQTALVAPFNDLEAIDRLLSAHPQQVAAIVLEPMLNAGGLIPPKPGYLEGIRRLADAHDVLLVFDEVMTSRMDTGGFQSLTGVHADITALGKIIGGGLAIGAFGGRKEIMALTEPGRQDGLTHAGTFNGHPLAMVAGIATMEALPEEEIQRISALGDSLRSGLNQAFEKAGIRGQSTGFGSMAQIHWGDAVINTACDTAVGMKAAGPLPSLVHLSLVTQGVLTAPRGAFCISTAMGEKEIEQAVNTLRDVLQEIVPVVEFHCPNLLIEKCSG